MAARAAAALAAVAPGAAGSACTSLDQAHIGGAANATDSACRAILTIPAIPTRAGFFTRDGNILKTRGRVNADETEACASRCPAEASISAAATCASAATAGAITIDLSFSTAASAAALT
jgi:hypothetical protein